MVVALLVGVAGGIKVNAVFVVLGIAIPLLHDRAWVRLIRIGVIAGLTTFGLYLFSYGLIALQPLGKLRRIADIKQSLPRQHRGVVGFGRVNAGAATKARLVALK